MSTTARRTLSDHARTAKAIRTKLKTVYPLITFSVKSESFAGGDAVRINWHDGPTTGAVDKLVSVHEAGRFDGMIDLYEYTNVHPNVPQVKYVQTSRNQSDETRAALLDWLNARYGYAIKLDQYGGIDHTTDVYTPSGPASHELHRVFHARSLCCPACSSPTLPADNFCPACGAGLDACRESLA